MDRLHHALAVRRAPDDDGSAVILQRGGEDLAGAGRTVVDEHDERESGPPGAALVRHVDDGIATALGRDDGTFRDEAARDLDRRDQHAARVAAQIEHERAHAVATQALERREELARGLVAERGDRDVSDAARCIGDAFLLHRRLENAARAHADIARHAVETFDDECDVARFRAGDQRLETVLPERRELLAVDAHEAIADAHAGRERRRVRQREEHATIATRASHHDSESAVSTAGLAVELSGLARAVILRVVVEPVGQAVQRLVEDFILGQVSHERAACVVANLAVARDVRFEPQAEQVTCGNPGSAAEGESQEETSVPVFGK